MKRNLAKMFAHNFTALKICDSLQHVHISVKMENDLQNSTFINSNVSPVSSHVKCVQSILLFAYAINILP